MKEQMSIYICEYCRLDYKDVQYDEAERMANYDLVCDSCNVNPFSSEDEEEDEQAPEPFGDGDWDGSIIHNDG